MPAFGSQRLPLMSVLAVVMMGSGCTTGRPVWIEAVPKGYENDYYTGEGSSRVSPAEARHAAIASAMVRLAQSGDIRLADTERDSIDRAELLPARGTPERSQFYRRVDDLEVTGQSRDIHGLRLAAEYQEWHDGLATSWVLLGLPKLTGRTSPPGSASLVARSLLVPGWGQLAKGETRSGAFILGSAAVLAPTGVILGFLRQEAALKAERAHTQVVRSYYTDRANAFGAGRLGAWAVGGALYLYGIGDAASSPPRLFVDADRRGVAVALALPVFGGGSRCERADCQRPPSESVSPYR